MFKRRRSNIVRLVINLTILGLIIIGGMFLVRSCWPKRDLSWELDSTALKVENIKKIAEISTVNYQDELVVDTIEYYKDLTEQVATNVTNLKDLENWKYSVRGSAIKRRLTIIVGGEVRFGFNLKDDRFQVKSTKDSIFIQLPEPKILNVLIVPSSVSVFQEHGVWHDNARVKLQRKADKEFRNRARNLNLEERSKAQIELLLRKMIVDKRILTITYR